MATEVVRHITGGRVDISPNSPRVFPPMPTRKEFPIDLMHMDPELAKQALEGSERAKVIVGVEVRGGYWKGTAYNAYYTQNYFTPGERVVGITYVPHPDGSIKINPYDYVMGSFEETANENIKIPEVWGFGYTGFVETTEQGAISGFRYYEVRNAVPEDPKDFGKDPLRLWAEKTLRAA